MRIETIGGATLYHGDCREILPTLTGVEGVVTDPPYGIGLNTDNSRFTGGNKASVSRRGRGKGPAGGAPIVGDDKPVSLDHLPCVPSIVWGWNNFAAQLPKGTCLVWIKRNDAAFGSFLSDAEIAWFSKGHGVYCFRDLSNFGITNDRAHPTQKPLALMLWCLGFLPKAQTILDPYMGSGTTGVACAKAGRKFIGIEIDEAYFDIACRRIEAAYAQQDFFVAPPVESPKQEAML